MCVGVLVQKTILRALCDPKSSQLWVKGPRQSHRSAALPNGRIQPWGGLHQSRWASRRSSGGPSSQAFERWGHPQLLAPTVWCKAPLIRILLSVATSMGRGFSMGPTAIMQTPEMFDQFVCGRSSHLIVIAWNYLDGAPSMKFPRVVLIWGWHSHKVVAILVNMVFGLPLPFSAANQIQHLELFAGDCAVSRSEQADKGYRPKNDNKSTGQSNGSPSSRRTQH